MAIIEGAISGNQVEVNSDKEQLVALNQDPHKAGVVVLAAELNDGSVTGNREILPLGVSLENRLAVGQDALCFNDQFNYSAQDTSNYRYPVTTQTISHSNGYIILNSGLTTGTNTNSAIQTYRSFPLFGGFGINMGVAALHTVAPQTNAVTEWGMFTATLPGGAIPTDGAYFRFTTSGTFRCIINYNGTEMQSGDLTIPALGVNQLYDILINEETVVFKLNGIVIYDIDTPTGQGQPFMCGAIPFAARHYIVGSSPASAMQFKISDVDINYSDINTGKPWAHTLSSYGHSIYQGQSGGTMGSTALYTNNLAPGTGTAATNTTAALGSGLGGQFAVLPTLTASTDGIIGSYQNPVGSTTQTPRTLIITGVKIDSAVTTVLVGGPVIYFYSLAFGHTAVSLATAESATIKAPRRVPLGIQSYAAAATVGTIGTTINIKFESPVTVYPGEFIQLVAKNVGTVTTTGVITILVSFDGYTE